MRLALRRCRAAFLGTAVMSGLINLLYLTGSFFMLEVYDRVIPSRSVPTLTGLLMLALALYAFQGVLEMLRARIFARTAASLNEDLGGRVFELVVKAPLKGSLPGDGLLPLRDLDAVRSFMSGSGPSAFFDLPWMPIYLFVCFLFHPLLGIMALAGVFVLAGLTVLTDRATRQPTLSATRSMQQRNALAEAGRRNAEVLQALGMQGRFANRWVRANDDHLQAQQSLSDATGGYATLSKTFRMVLQSGVLALGAWLVINNMATGGIIIASSILVSRALAPAEQAIANWKGFVQARQSWRRLADLLTRIPPSRPLHALPAPRRSLVAEAVSVAPPGVPRLIVHDVSLVLQAGQGLGIIGLSASGKSTLARCLAGIWPAVRGKVRLDGAALEQWSAVDLGPHLGFLPQEVELFAGTISENIARFDPAASAEAVIAAAQAAGVHELILRLSDGYDTRLGEGGSGLSAGQRQRVGLARALYGEPFLVILDEPNANLDAVGEHALTQAILGVRRRGGICIVVAHRPSALAAVDLVLMMTDGRVHAFGPKEEVLRRVLQTMPPAPPAQMPARPEDVGARATQGSLR
ncbi:type I secretion system permease/ATPase [Methylobacterium sp. C25]|uniref:type I secretion system permease/ATPase n=1 Tax=Methylobacterium sp. C25 TaxID=2721622 RepID=UPI001F42C8AC|nr:type I secretion system permease/ATPase [Methylobacterium sp. C25]